MLRASSPLLCTVGVAAMLTSVACPAHAEVEVPVDYDATPPPSQQQPAASPTPPESPAAPARPEPNVPLQRYWYGYQTLIVDGTSVAAFVSGIAFQSAPLGYAGMAGYIAGGPAVHAANARPKMAFASVGIRLGMPALGMIAGFTAAGPCHEHHQSLLGDCFLHGAGEAMIGAGVGMTIAIALDASLLSRGVRERPAPERGVARVTSVAPIYDPHTRAAGAAVGGSF